MLTDCKLCTDPIRTWQDGRGNHRSHWSSRGSFGDCRVYGNVFSGANGSVPLIYAYNENKDTVGSSKDSPSIDSDSFQEVVISQQPDVLSDSVLPWVVLSQMSPRNVTSRDPRVISSPYDVHSAQNLCGSASSKRPDFVPLGEGIYCDMTTKIQWPLCSTSVVTNCYNWSTHSLVTPRRLMARDYRHVFQWYGC